MDIKQAHRYAVALNPTPKYTVEWPDRRRAYNSQRSAANKVIDCLRILMRLYLTTSESIVIKLIPSGYNKLIAFLVTLQSMQLQTNEPKSKNYRNHPQHTRNPSSGYRVAEAMWRTHVPEPIQYTYAKSMANLYPAQARAKETENLLNINTVLIRLNETADFCLDFAPHLVDTMRPAFADIAHVMQSVRPERETPKFTTIPLDPNNLTPPPAKFFNAKENTPEWRRRQREKYHAQHVEELLKYTSKEQQEIRLKQLKENIRCNKP